MFYSIFQQHFKLHCSRVQVTELRLKNIFVSIFMHFFPVSLSLNKMKLMIIFLICFLLFDKKYNWQQSMIARFPTTKDIILSNSKNFLFHILLTNSTEFSRGFFIRSYYFWQRKTMSNTHKKIVKMIQIRKKIAEIQHRSFRIGCWVLWSSYQLLFCHPKYFLYC